MFFTSFVLNTICSPAPSRNSVGCCGGTGAQGFPQSAARGRNCGVLPAPSPALQPEAAAAPRQRRAAGLEHQQRAAIEQSMKRAVELCRRYRGTALASHLISQLKPYDSRASVLKPILLHDNVSKPALCQVELRAVGLVKTALGQDHLTEGELTDCTTGNTVH